MYMYTFNVKDRSVTIMYESHDTKSFAVNLFYWGEGVMFGKFKSMIYKKSVLNSKN